MKSEITNQIFIEVSSEHRVMNIVLSEKSNASFSDSAVDFENSIEFLGKHGHKSILKASGLMITQLREDWSYRDDLGIQHSYERTLFFYLRFYMHYWLLNIYIIDQAIKKHSPKCIYIQESISLSAVSNNANLLSLIVRQYVKFNNLDIQISEKKSEAFTSGIFTKNKFMCKRVLNTMLSFISRVYQPLLKNKKIILIADDSYNMTGLLNKLKKKDPAIFPVYLNVSGGKLITHLKKLLSGRELFFLQGSSNKTLSSNLQGALDRFSSIINNYNNDSIFNFLGVDLRSILSNYIAKSTTLEMSSLECSIKQVNALIGFKPYMALSQHALGYSYALGEMCLMKNIPGLLITHGTHVLQQDKYAKMEWNEHARTIINAHYPYTAIQSPMADEFFSSQINKHSISLKTGPLIYSEKSTCKPIINLKQELIGQKNMHKKVVLHAGTPKSVSAMRPWVYETTDEYIRNINDLIDVVDDLKDVFLVIRFRPSSELNKSYFCSLIKSSDNCGVYSEGSFGDYLAISDLLVSYSSTTIEEALQNDVAVLQYDHDDKYMHIQAPAISEGQEFDINPIYYCGNKDKLKNSIDIILKNIDLITSEKNKWDCYRYPIDKKLEWFDKLLSK